MINHKFPQKAYVVSVDMGYGHQRASYPLKDMVLNHKIINANNYPGIPAEDKQIWRRSQSFYEFISRFKNVPLIGETAFNAFDKFQEIPGFYPKRDLSKMTAQLLNIIRLIKNKNWGFHLINKLEKKPLPLITTFFATAFMAEIYNYSQEIYLVVCDADISRGWVMPKAARSRINYFVPCQRVAERLKLYGVRTEKIFLTGFPLPKKNLGDQNLNVLKKDFSERLKNLDPDNIYLAKYKKIIIEQLGAKNLAKKANHPLTLTFAVGGAGAQRELGLTILDSLSREIAKKKIKINLIAGIHNDVNQYFKKGINELKLTKFIGKQIKIIFAQNKEEYFEKFNLALRTTDILWTKPSELSFYVALGIPIIIAPPIGSQEKFNRHWLRTIGAGLNQEGPRYVNEWLFDWLRGGLFAEAAVHGFLEAAKLGTYNIEKIVAGQPQDIKAAKEILQY